MQQTLLFVLWHQQKKRLGQTCFPCSVRRRKTRIRLREGGQRCELAGELWPCWSTDMNVTTAKEKSFCILLVFIIGLLHNCIVENAFLVQYLGPILKLAARKWSKFGGNSLSGCCPLGMRRKAAGKKGDWMGERERDRTCKTRSSRGREREGGRESHERAYFATARFPNRPTSLACQTSQNDQ